MKRLLISTLTLAIFTACDTSSDGSNGTKEEKYFSNHWNNTGSTDKGKTQLEPNAQSEGRHSRRLTVEHLRASIPMLFNGITWEEVYRGVNTNAFDALSRTLGEADYIEVTVANTEPSPLFAKFMDDMAGNVCEAAIAADRQTDSSNRSVVAFESDVDQNLRFLRLKLHSIYVPETSVEGLEDLRRLYDDILGDTNSPEQAWTGVCIAMLTAPEFMAY